MTQDTEDPQVLPDAGPRPIGYHALLVEVFATGQMRVRIDNGFLATADAPPMSETKRPETGVEPVAPLIAFQQVEDAAQSFAGMLRAVYSHTVETSEVAG